MGSTVIHSAAQSRQTSVTLGNPFPRPPAALRHLLRHMSLFLFLSIAILFVHGAWSRQTRSLPRSAFNHQHHVVQREQVGLDSRHALNIPPSLSNPLHPGPRNIAVIGAGPGGSSFANFVSKAFPTAHIDLYESMNRAGGRCMSERLIISERLNLSILVESGASIFVEENQNIVRAAREFQLTMNNYDTQWFQEDKKDKSKLNSTLLHTDGRVKDERIISQTHPIHITVWNGTHSLFDMDINGGWRSGFRSFLRYGLGSVITGRLANAAAAKLSEIYHPDHPSYGSWPEMVDGLGLRPETRISAADYASVHGINNRFVNEVMETTTRVNYGRNLDEVHSLAALIGFVKGPTYNILEGNQRIYEEFLKRSNANVNFNTQVHSIFEAVNGSTSPSSHGYQIMVSSKDDPIPRNISTTYDLVVMAVPPPAFGSITIPFHTVPMPKVKYHHIYVTFILGKLNRRTFPNRPVQVLPTKSVKYVQSISLIYDYGYELVDMGLGLYKVFSTIPLTESQNTLDLLFEVTRKIWSRQWLSYPIMRPEPIDNEANDTPTLTDEFYPPLLLHRLPSKRPGTGGLYYLNGIERFVSTMETVTVASRNLVRLLQDEISGTVTRHHK